MLVVSDAGPIRYLALLGHVDVLGTLFGRVVTPLAVANELSHPRSPEPVRRWLESPPSWFVVEEVQADAPEIPALGAGERHAIALATRLGADALLCDDAMARAESERRGLRVIGTLAIIRDASLAGMIDGGSALNRLRHQTNFRASKVLYDAIRRDLGLLSD